MPVQNVLRINPKQSLQAAVVRFLMREITVIRCFMYIALSIFIVTTAWNKHIGLTTTATQDLWSLILNVLFEFFQFCK